jgi:hypothetical protein
VIADKALLAETAPDPKVLLGDKSYDGNAIR